MTTVKAKISYLYLQRVMAIPVATLLLTMFSFSLSAQTQRTLDHIEVHGETGKGDTGIVYFTNGIKEKYFLNDPSENKQFQQKYGAMLKHQQEKVKEPGAKHKDEPASIQYEPLNPVPENIAEITFGGEMIWLKLRNGKEEQYNLRDEEEKKSFESKYGVLKMKKK